MFKSAHVLCPEACKKTQSLSCRLNIEDRGLEDIEDRGSSIKPQRIDPFPLPKSSPTGPASSAKVLVELALQALGPHLGPEKPQDGRRWPQDGPKMAQDGPRWPKMAPRWPQDGPKRAQDGPQMAPSWRKREGWISVLAETWPI